MAKFKVEVQGTGLGDFEVEAHSFKDNQNGEFIDFLDFEEPRTPSHHEDTRSGVHQVLRVRASLVKKIERMPDTA